MPAPLPLRPGLPPLFAEIATCLRFFSRLPLSGGWRPDGPPLSRSLRLLPLAGLLIGALVALPTVLATLAGLPSAIAAGLGVLCGLFATGGLHEDGLADTADGFGGGATRERKLAIMRDSRIGTYGVLALILSLGLRTAAMATLLERAGPRDTAFAILGAAALSRTLALLPMATLPPARADGLGHGIGRPARRTLLTAFGLAALLGLGLPWAGGAGLAHAILACLLAVAASGGVTRLASRHIGGHTGDIGGASQQVAEAAYLLGLLAFPGLT